MAAARALAALAKEPVPGEVLAAYGVKELTYGRDYVIPKPLDPRILTTVTPAVAQAAMDSGAATRPIADMTAYAEQLRKRIDAAHARIRPFVKQLAAQSGK